MKGQGFLYKSISSFTGALESVILTESLGRRHGLLQKLDPRIKLVTTLLFIITVSLAHSLWSLAITFVLIMSLSLFSRIPPGFFVKRLLLFIPIFAVVIAVPALFITPGDPLLHIARGVTITLQGARTAGFLVLRVTDSLSFGLLLIMTTPWNNILVTLHWFRIPALVVDILGMTYRYIYLYLHTANSMFLARRSRTIGTFSASENRRWLLRALGTTLARTQHLSEEVYMAMLSRGYKGEMHVLSDFRLKPRDFLWAAFVLISAAILLWINIL